MPLLVEPADSARSELRVEVPPSDTRARVPFWSSRGLRWLELLGVGLVLSGSALLNLIGLHQEGFGNTYYAAAVWSMLQNWHAFLFASFDAVGFVSVDKPPVGLWLQVLSARLFGFNGPALLLPQAICGVLSVAVLYVLVRRAFDPLAGFVAALALAVTPISVVTNRNNTMDATLVLVLLLAAWAISIAAERGTLRMLLLGATTLGVAFNVKMLQAYPVVPGFLLGYLVYAPLRWRRRVLHVLFAGAVLVLVSLSWSAFVDLTPAALRPYVGSSGSNSALSLAIGYNGLSRLTLAIAERVPALSFLGTNLDLQVAPGMAPGIGSPGLFRLFGPTLAAQASWLIPLALVGLLVGGWIALGAPSRGSDGQIPRRRKGVALLVWGSWLLIWGAIFSFARFYHVYYLVMLGPAVAALAGIAVATLWRLYRSRGAWWSRVLLPLTVLGSAWFQFSIVSPATAFRAWLPELVIAGSAAAAVGLLVGYIPRVAGNPVGRASLTIGVAALLVAPLTWSVVSVQNGNGGAWLPEAGPNPSSTFGGGALQAGAGQRGGGGGMAITFAGSQWNRLDPGLIRYLEANQAGSEYLVATQSSSYASLFILNTGQPALALGGYQGWDDILTPDDLASLVDTGAVRFFYLPLNATARGPGTSLDATRDLVAWVEANCSIVPSSQWQSDSNSSNGMQLYAWNVG